MKESLRSVIFLIGFFIIDPPQAELIEGVSMAKNYRTQFKEIIAKDSPRKVTGKFAKKSWYLIFEPK